jgi:hypothetical protein
VDLRLVMTLHHYVSLEQTQTCMPGERRPAVVLCAPWDNSMGRECEHAQLHCCFPVLILMTVVVRSWWMTNLCPNARHLSTQPPLLCLGFLKTQHCTAVSMRGMINLLGTGHKVALPQLSTAPADAICLAQPTDNTDLPCVQSAW